MQKPVFFFVMISSLWVSVSAAEEILIGRVQSVDLQTGSIIMRLPEEAYRFSGGRGAYRGRGALAQFSETAVPSKITVTYNRDRFISKIRQGGVIRVWGEFEQVTGSFRANKIFYKGCESFFSDPTGVRRRLGKGGGMFIRKRNRHRGGVEVLPVRNGTRHHDY